MTKPEENPQGLDRTPVLIDTSEWSMKIRAMVHEAKSHIIGQDRAVEMLAQSAEIDEAGLLKPGALAGRYYFAGPAGVGKTQLAYEWAFAWIGRLLRDQRGDLIEPITNIDCTQFADSHQVSRLVGSANEYVGYGDPTPLAQHFIDNYAMQVVFAEELELMKAEVASRKPKSKRNVITDDDRRLIAEYVEEVYAPFKKVFLFDEVDRGHFNLWNLLITIMNGKTFKFGDETTSDFSRGVLIMSSNINEQEIKEIMKGGIGFKGDWAEADPEKLQEVIYKQTLKKIEKMFPPPFVSRIRKSIVVFRALSDGEYGQILDLRLGEVEALFAKEHGHKIPKVKFVFTSECKAYLLKKGIDRLYGARPLEQMLEKHVTLPLARAINRQANIHDSSEIKAGDTVVFDLENGEIRLFVQR